MKKWLGFRFIVLLVALQQISMITFLECPSGSRIAYQQTRGKSPGVVFLPGFKSEMNGTKGTHLEKWAKHASHAFVRFDYSGHGRSSGKYVDGTVGGWLDESLAVIKTLTAGRQVLVGSSLGAWISLLIAKKVPDRVCGVVCVAPAPDFTEDVIWEGLSEAERSKLVSNGKIEQASAYSSEPYVISHRLIAEARSHLVLRSPLMLPFPVRILHGTADTDIPPAVALRLLNHVEGANIRLTLVKGADHRFSSTECLQLITDAVEEVIREGST